MFSFVEFFTLCILNESPYILILCSACLDQDYDGEVHIHYPNCLYFCDVTDYFSVLQLTTLRFLSVHSCVKRIVHFLQCKSSRAFSGKICNEISSCGVKYVFYFAAYNFLEVCPPE